MLIETLEFISMVSERVATYFSSVDVMLKTCLPFMIIFSFLNEFVSLFRKIDM